MVIFNEMLEGGGCNIVREAWFYHDGQIRERFKELLKRIWKGDGFSEE